MQLVSSLIYTWICAISSACVTKPLLALVRTKFFYYSKIYLSIAKEVKKLYALKSILSKSEKKKNILENYTIM